MGHKTEYEQDKKDMRDLACLDVPAQHVWYVLYSLTHPKVLLQDQHFHAARERKKKNF